MLRGLRDEAMANIHSQKKRILRSERERLENRRYTSTIKTYFRRLEGHVRGGEDDAAQAAHRELVSTIDKAVKRGALHRNTGDHRKSRAARVLAGGDKAS
jgi:small subunit ribosomal protein S20